MILHHNETPYVPRMGEPIYTLPITNTNPNQWETVMVVLAMNLTAGTIFDPHYQTYATVFTTGNDVHIHNVSPTLVKACADARQAWSDLVNTYREGDYRNT